MSTDNEYDLHSILIRAGRRAWELYIEVNSDSALGEDVAESLLTKHLVVLARKGMMKEGPLAAAGLRYLISLTAPQSLSKPFDDAGANERTRQPLEFFINSANAKFLLQWRISWARTKKQRASTDAVRVMKITSIAALAGAAFHSEPIFYKQGVAETRPRSILA